MITERSTTLQIWVAPVLSAAVTLVVLLLTLRSDTAREARAAERQA
jgi:hypothetical protein